MYISTRAKVAIGFPYDKAPLAEGSDADLVIMGIAEKNETRSTGGSRRSILDIICDSTKDRRTIYKGYLIRLYRNTKLTATSGRRK